MFSERVGTGVKVMLCSQAWTEGGPTVMQQQGMCPQACSIVDRAAAGQLCIPAETPAAYGHVLSTPHAGTGAQPHVAKAG